jgi:beta-carotene hydroxylase
VSPSLKSALEAPAVAVPTVALALAAGAASVTGALLVAGGAFFAGLALMTLGAYLAFTPLHDATHGAVAKSAWFNELIGRLSVVPLFGPYAAFRYVHLEHHLHTNDPERDPDFWSSRGPRALLPLRWMTQDLHYYVTYLRAGRARAEVVEVVCSLALLLALVAALVVTGFGLVALAWLISSRLALGVLACAFDYLPHAPHLVLGREDRFRATTVRAGLLWQVLLLNQSLHLVHHLQPHVPFYKYGDLWRAQEVELRARGAVVVNEPAQQPLLA